VIGGKKLWVAELPEARNGRWIFRELWVNGRRAVRRSAPRPGLSFIDALPDKAAEWTQGQARFGFHEGDLKAWAGVTNAEVSRHDPLGGVASAGRERRRKGIGRQLR